MITNEQRTVIKDVLEKYSPSYVGIFGSYARNEDNEGSDLDILIDFRQQIDLLELIGMEQQLTQLLGVKVDLVTQRSVNKKLMPYIVKDLIQIV